MALELYMKTLLGPTSKVNIVTDNCSSTGSFASSSMYSNNDSTCSISLLAMHMKQHGRSNRMCFSPADSSEPGESRPVAKRSTMDNDREQPQKQVLFYSFSPSWGHDGSFNHRSLESFHTPIELRIRNRRLNHGDMDISPLIRPETYNHESPEARVANTRIL